MNVLIVIMLTLVGLGGAAVVFSGSPQRQALMLSAYGLVLALLFMVLQAPDVSLSQIGVGTAIVPLMVMLAVRKTQRRVEPGGDGDEGGSGH
jgi:energy-converting hydrogenase B subunit D